MTAVAINPTTSTPTTNPLAEGLHDYRVGEPCIMVIFGATGDLSGRKLLPALYNLAKQRLLPAGFAVVGAAIDDMTDDSFRKHADELGARIRARLEQLAARNAAVGEVRGLGPMLALELTEPTPDLAKAVTSAARDRGLVLLSCGIYGNVIRILVPLTIDDALLERGLDLLEESLGDARAG
jgi:hypothetical protein